MPSKTPIQIGYLDKIGHPSLKISVHGIHADLKEDFEAMIDTGFTGFLMMPIMSALPLGLTLMGTSNYTLADNSTSAKLLAIGTVTFNEEAVSGVIVLESNQCGLLLGMDFLRRAKKSLIVSINGVVLVDEDVVEQSVKAIAELAAAQAAGADGASHIPTASPSAPTS